MPNELPEQKWLLKDKISTILGKFCRLLTAFDRCTLNKGALFASEIFPGDFEMVAYRRVTLDRGECSSRFDCIKISALTEME